MICEINSNNPRTCDVADGNCVAISLLKMGIIQNAADFYKYAQLTCNDSAVSQLMTSPLGVAQRIAAAPGIPKDTKFIYVAIINIDALISFIEYTMENNDAIYLSLYILPRTYHAMVIRKVDIYTVQMFDNNVVARSNGVDVDVDNLERFLTDNNYNTNLKGKQPIIY